MIPGRLPPPVDERSGRSRHGRRVAVALVAIAIGAAALIAQSPPVDTIRGDELPRLAAELATAPPPRLDALQSRLSAALRTECRALARRGPPWSREALTALAARLLVDPDRFAGDRRFRARALPVLVTGADTTAPRELLEALLYSVQQLVPLEFDVAESVEAAWGLAPRPSVRREVELMSEGEVVVVSSPGPIAASVFSLSSAFFDIDEIEAFLRAVRAASPDRALVVLSDWPLRTRIAQAAREIGAHLVETYGRPYSPWPRDPLTFMRRADGGGLLLLRPNPQSLRETDSLMGREIVKGLAAGLDEALGGLVWARSPLPFHNGHILLTPGTTWVSIHTFEPRMLELLGLDRVPVESFSTAEGIDRYLAAARRAAEELEHLYGQPVRFVHALPEGGSPASRTAAMQRLGGGAGFDLDTLLTLLPTDGALPAALVADLDAGAELVQRVVDEELAQFGRDFELDPGRGGLRARLARSFRSPKARALQTFLDLMAEQLQTEGLAVARLPLLLVPVDLLPERADIHHPDFLVGWNNVVLEQRGETRRAEGFASLLPAGDATALQVFARLGYELDLFPPLVESIRLNGGYRCASTHLAALEAAPGSSVDGGAGDPGSAGPLHSASGR